jgi:CYTH domain-containing protein
MFAAQAGAKHIYAVDCSSIIEQAKAIVQKNGFADKITMIRGKIEEIELPVPQVDIIVSEWMGKTVFSSTRFSSDKSYAVGSHDCQSYRLLSFV